jgi:outer membrane protein assembly factor BamB
LQGKLFMQKKGCKLIATFFLLCSIMLPYSSIVIPLKNINKSYSSNIDFPQQCDYYNSVDITFRNTTPIPIDYPTSIFIKETLHSGHQWPQQGFNCQHVGRSPYDTTENPGVEKWRFPAGYWCDSSPVIDANGTIYFGSSNVYAIFPNDTLKWAFDVNNLFGEYGTHPGIDNDGTIYAATAYGSYLHAINPNGVEKWRCNTPDIDTSITVATDGILYYGHWQGVDARYPNGTLKWRFSTEPPDSYVMSTPAVDDNGIIYFGSHDTYVYAVYPNGTMKWRFPTGNWVHGSPTIDSNGTIYIGCDSGYLYALYPNGTMKWRTMVGSMRSSPSLDKQGNLYFGVWDSRITSVAPNGTMRWVFPLRDRDRVWGSTAAISDDGTVYIGNSIDMDMNGGGEIIALTLNGTLKWRKTICDSSLYSSPVIASDGAVYICGSNDAYYGAWGYLYGFNTIENNQPPEAPTIDGPQHAKVRTDVIYTLQAKDPDKTPVHYLVDWGDGSAQEQTHDMEPGVPIKVYHSWSKRGTYAIKAKAIDTFGLESNWTTLSVKMPINYEPLRHPFLDWFFQQFQHVFQLLQHFLNHFLR